MKREYRGMVAYLGETGYYRPYDKTISASMLSPSNVAGPMTSSEGMKDGSDAIADWAYLSAQISAAA
jgi:hypothetical protein